MINLGMGETLMRATPQQRVAPWLAETVSQVDATTWRVALRNAAQFHDGSSVSAADVAASFKRNWETQPAADGFISKDTQLTVVDPLTLDFKTPQPNGSFVNSLSAFQFVVHKPGSDPNTALMTGPYRPVKLVTDQQLQLGAFAGHWAGPPPIAGVTIRRIADQQSQSLALQSGDIDLAVTLPPNALKDMPPNIARIVSPSVREITAVFNTKRPPFSDRSVREATALAIDREALLTIALDGLGAVAAGIFPPNVGVSVVSAQMTDVQRAKQLLDAVGWAMGSDSVRVKDGKRLAFTLFSYSGFGNLTTQAEAIAGQLRPLGYEIQVQEVPNAPTRTKGGDFDAAMVGFNTLVTGDDPLYMFNVALATGGLFNLGGYSSPRIDALLAQLRAESDAAKRTALSLQVQEIAKGDVPLVYLDSPPLVDALNKDKVQNFIPNPNDLYLMDSTVSVT